MSIAKPGLATPALADAKSIRQSMRRTRRRNNLRAAALIAPLFVFLSVFFFYPVGSMLYRSIENQEVRAGLPNTLAAIKNWDGNDLPDEKTFAALAEDLRSTQDRSVLGRAARRLNYENDGLRSLIFETSRKMRSSGSAPYKEALIAMDERWGKRALWAAIARNSSPVTDHFLLGALDYTRDENQAIVPVGDKQAIFADVYSRTFWVALLVATFCLLLGYPFAYLLAHLSTSVSNLMMFFVLLPFWTALLARTTAWIVLLQREGLVNETLRVLGITSQPIPLVFNRTGVLIAMTHVLLPFAILPLYSTMKSINPVYTRAAISLGASPLAAFRLIYFPMTLPGLAAAGLLVFILALGYYVTPALVGGSQDQLISSFIAIYTDTYLNWGQASALAAVLLVAVLVLYLIYYRITGGAQFQLR